VSRAQLDYVIRSAKSLANRRLDKLKVEFDKLDESDTEGQDKVKIKAHQEVDKAYSDYAKTAANSSTNSAHRAYGVFEHNDFLDNLIRWPEEFGKQHVMPVEL